jgi:hypothetical protein
MSFAKGDEDTIGGSNEAPKEKNNDQIGKSTCIGRLAVGLHGKHLLNKN